jgi:hypothetical protein
MSKNIRTQTGKIIGKTLNSYHARTKSAIDKLKFKEQYQGRIIDCIVGEVDDNYIETPETDSPIVKLEHSKEGVIKVPTIKGKTILIDAEGNETDTPAEGCRLVSVGENEDNKLIILSNNSMIDNSKNKFGSIDINTGVEQLHNNTCIISGYNLIDTDIGVMKLYDTNFNMLSGTTNYNNVTKRYYDKNKKYLGANKTENAFFVRYRCLTVNNFKFEKDAGNYIFKSSDTDNKLYQQHKTEILLDEPLRSLPNGVCDEIIGNKLIRRVGTMFIDGSQHWGATQSYDLTYKFGMGMPHSIVKSTVIMTDNIRYTQKLNLEEEGSRTQICIYNHQTQKEIRVSFLKSDYPMITNNAGTVEEYFKEHPLLLLYELAEPVITELPNSITLQGFDDTTMYIENEITPTVQYGYNALIPYKKELKTQQQEVETNTLDIEQNIIPYLMDMEMNLMLMED